MQHFCQVMHSFAKRRKRPSRLLALAGDQILQRSSKLDLHKVSVCLYSLAMFSSNEDTAIQSLISRASYLMDVHAYQQGKRQVPLSSSWQWPEQGAVLSVMRLTLRTL